MFVQFAVENHRSIRRNAVVSCAASKDKSFAECLLRPDEKTSLLPAIAIYGANAAGKSNVLHAMKTMKDLIAGNASKLSKGQKLPQESFGGIRKPTSFETIFIHRGIRYTYGFSFDADKIYSEYLYESTPGKDETLVFSRDNGAYAFRDNIGEQITLSRRTPDNKLYLVSSNDWNLPQTENAYRWFREGMTFLADENPASCETVARIAEGNDKKARILKELMVADLGIADVTLTTDPGKLPTIATTHRAINEDGTAECFRLPMERESAGTQQFFARIGGWLQALENGSLLAVDEIENSLHPLLTKHLIEMVQDKSVNPNGAQLIFTTHDALLLDLAFFRRDQIWFAEKNDMTCDTELYSLAAFSPRKRENARNAYLSGRFGAIPFIAGAAGRL